MYKTQVELGWLQRPARRQVDESTLKQLAHRDASTHNIWSGRSLDRPPGGPEDRALARPAKERSKYRCRPEVDVGRTRGSDAKQMTFCLYFAKGCCAQGSACVYLHRLPTEEDEEYHRKDMGTDIFGHEKRSEAEGFRKGAGTMERDNRTMYCNYEGAGSYDLPKIRQLIEDNFSPWGPIKRIYIVHVKTLAFIEYEWRSSAEFAKEAMHKQGLRGSSQKEVLTLRWANEDPNPATVLAVKRSHMDAFEKAALASWEALPEEQKQARIQQLQMTQALHKGRVVADYPQTDDQYADQQYPSTDDQYPAGAAGGSAYPSTDAQYEQGTAEAEAAGGSWYGGQQQAPENMTQEEYDEYCRQYYAYYYGQQGAEAQAAGTAGQGGAEQGAGGEDKDGAGNALSLLAGYGSGSDDGEGEGEGEDTTREQAGFRAGQGEGSSGGGQHGRQQSAEQQELQGSVGEQQQEQQQEQEQEQQQESGRAQAVAGKQQDGAPVPVAAG